MDQQQTTLITGATSGIGRALAMALAGPGITLHLGGRDAGRLDQVADLCRARGALVQTQAVDVTDRAAVEGWIGGCGRLDQVIASAGISGGTHGGAPESPEQIRAIFATNLDGAINIVLAALAHMAAQSPDEHGVRGRIAAIASIAGFIALPHSPSYCASKAALDRWTVASAPQARRLGVRLISVCPGYVRTPMTDRNRFPMPGLMEADRAARIILRGIEADRARVVFPGWFGAFTRIAGMLPQGWIEKITRRVPDKL